MTDYNVLETENSMPEVLKNKPRWVTCVALAIGILVVTISAVMVGLFIGYTYCYLEHRVIVRTGNITQSNNFQIFHFPLNDSQEGKYNRTINGALSNVVIARLLTIGHAILDEEMRVSLPWANEDPSVNNAK